MNYTDKDACKATILIIDDVEINRDILENIIDCMGYRPVVAESGERALELIEEFPPQLILSDISMPGMDGYELCKILKKREKTKDVPIIFISAYDAPEDIVEGFLVGGEDFITKPFIPEEVEARVGVHLRLYEMTRELLEMNRRLQISVNEQLKQMELEKKNILYALADIAAQNSSNDKEYMERLKKNCRILAQAMQLSMLYEEKISDTYIDTIELAAPLCDIGNIGVAKEILQKETGLTEEEMAAVQSHTEIGAKLLSDLHGSSDYNDFINISTDIAHYHHENWDGSGYPEGLKKDEIPLAAQIVSLVSRYCTLTEKENNREEALAIMREEAGEKFNPDIFEICSKISRQLY
jgi:putative two-component system response regulator